MSTTKTFASKASAKRSAERSGLEASEFSVQPDGNGKFVIELRNGAVTEQPEAPAAEETKRVGPFVFAPETKDKPESQPEAPKHDVDAALSIISERAPRRSFVTAPEEKTETGVDLLQDTLTLFRELSDEQREAFFKAVGAKASSSTAAPAKAPVDPDL